MDQEHQEFSTIPEMVEDVRAGKLQRRHFMKTLTAMGISAAGAGIIASVAGSRSSFQKPHVVEHAQEQEERNLHLHQQHIAHQMNNNSGAMQNDYHEHAVVDDSMREMPYVGREAIMSRKSLTAIPDLKLHVKNRVAHGPQVTVEWIAEGTHTTDFPGLPATGRPFSIHGVTVVVRHEGKVVRESIFYDVAEVHRQLRVR